MFDAIGTLATAWWRDEEGASLVEYILMVALVAVVSVGAITFLGKVARDKFNVSATALQNAK